MEDISTAISQILSDPEKVKQIQAMAGSLGLGLEQGNTSTEAGEGSASSEVLTGSVPSMPDLSSLSGLLSGISGVGSQGQNTQQSSGFDVSALAGMLRAGNPAQTQGSNEAGGFNVGTLLKLQQAMANVQQNRANIDLLLALKPRLSEARTKKVDDAIRIMQVIQFLPMLKETGLFGEMDNIIGKLGNIAGGLGSTGALSGLGNLGGIGNMLGGLLGTSGRR